MWYTWGIPYLYEEICIRRAPQLPALLYALRSSSEDLAGYVKIFRLPSVLPEDAPDFVEDIVTISQLCPHLSRVALGEPQLYTNLYTCAPVFFNLHVTHLCIDSYATPPPAVLTGVLNRIGEHLGYLCIRIPCNSVAEADMEISTAAVRFPVLDSLTCLVEHTNIEYPFRIMNDSWKMPKLRRFSTRHADYSGCRHSNEVESRHQIGRFFDVHGSKLHFVNLASVICRILKDDLALKVLKTTPLLEHLVIHPLDLKTNDVFIHKNLQWVDFRQPFDKSMAPEGAIGGLIGEGDLQALRKRLPALRGVRNLWALPGHLGEWLDSFPPGAVSTDLESFSFDMYTRRLRCEVGSVFWEGDVDGYETDESDESYEDVTESESSEESVSDSEEDLSD